MNPGQSYGQALPDQVERIAALFDSHLEAVSDVRDIYKERVALEREYATRLQGLAKKASDKKLRVQSNLVLGEEPTKSWDAHTLKQSTLNVVYDEIINSIVNTAQDHIDIADALNLQVIDVLKTVERKNDEQKKKEMQFFQKLLADRDRTNAERQKSKLKYDEECGEVETQRQKQSRSHDDRHADRIARQSEQQRSDMLNSKNVYIISTAIANRTRTKFYENDLPDIENQFQLMQTRLVERFSKILAHAQVLQLGHLDVLRTRLTAVEASLSAINPQQDQALFIEHNIRPFNPPPDWKFEPCVHFYDTDTMSVEPAPKVFLQNKLSRSRGKLQELGPVISSKRREFEQLEKLVSAYTADRSLGNIDEISDNYLDARHQLAYFVTSECILTTEIETILGAVGDDVGAESPHTFKSSSFSIPTTCGYCKTSIWGLSKQGKTCKVCGLSVHSKCELKVPADCQKGGSPRQVAPVGRSPSTASSIRPSTLETGSRPQAPTASSFVTSVPEDAVSYPVARVLFDFAATSEFELRVSEGSNVNVLEPDDGSGWVKVADERGNNGLVPASYLEYAEDAPAAATSSAVSEEGSGQYVRVVYPYEAQGSDEIGLAVGETIELSSGPNGGQDYGDGWWEGINSGGKKGIFPSNYVQLA